MFSRMRYTLLRRSGLRDHVDKAHEIHRLLRKGAPRSIVLRPGARAAAVRPEGAPSSFEALRLN